jgi:hypothetical protein
MIPLGFGLTQHTPFNTDKLFDAAVIFLLSLGDFGVLQSEKFVHL